jgi:hypothetical protein
MFIIAQMKADGGEAVRLVVARNQSGIGDRLGCDPRSRFTESYRRGVRSGSF